VENKSLALPAGSRICDLSGLIIPSADADLHFFKRRRLLKNQDVIEVPRLSGGLNTKG
jgi:hypothetical protein